jgi:hypothetical protein
MNTEEEIQIKDIMNKLAQELEIDLDNPPRSTSEELEQIITELENDPYYIHLFMKDW